MADNAAKTKIVIEGEQEYINAIKQAQKNLNALKKELKAETAELEANGKSQDKAKVKQESLKKQIAEQEKVVAQLREALAKAKDKYGDNEEVVQKWANKLNDARTTLANMQTDLNNLSNGMEQVSGSTEMGVVATQSFADAISGISSVAGSVADKCSEIFNGIVSTIEDVIGKVWDEVMALADKANSWSDIAGFWGTSTTEIQKWSHAVEGSYNGFEQLTGAVRKFALGGKEKEISEMLNIDKSNFASDWEYGIACMNRLYEIAKDTSGEVDKNKLDNIYATIFGERRAEGVMDIINDWETVQSRLAMFDVENGGIGMTEEQMADMSTLAEQVATIKETWQAFKDSFIAGAVGKVGLDLVGDAQNILNDFINVMNAKDESARETALGQMESDIKEFFTTLAGAIRDGISVINDVAQELKTSDDPAVKAIGQIIEDITGAFEWLTDPANWDAIKMGINTFFAIWTGAEVMKAVGVIAELAANIKTITAFKGLSNLTSGLGGAGAGVAGGLSLGGAGLALTVAAATITIASAILGTDWKKAFEDYDKGQETVQEVAAAKGYDNAWDMYWGDKAKGENVDTRTGIRALGAAIFGTSEDVDKVLYGDKQEETQAENRAAIEANTDSLQEMIGLLYTRGRGGAGWSSVFSGDQQEAIEAWWDAYRNDPYGDTWSDAYEAMAQAYGGEGSALFDRLDDALSLLIETGYTGEDLPDWMFNPDEIVWGANGPQLLNNVSTAVDAMPRATAAAVARAVGGLRVDMNGATVGRIVAPYVNEFIGAYID